MLLDEKPVEEFTLDDIDTLKSQPVCESHRLDYKANWWGDNDEGKREMLRDISAFANASGGHIVIGVATERDQGAGGLECPTEVVGVPAGSYTDGILRSCRDNFDPPCPGIEATQIGRGNDRTVVVVRVPESLSAPHMVTFRGLNQFWQRHGTDKQPMSTAEVRDVMLTRITAEEKLQGLIAHQFEELRRLPVKPLLWLWTAPLMPQVQEVDIKDLELRRLLHESTRTDPYGHNCELYSGTPKPTLKGLRAQEQVPDEIQHLELHRAGYLGFVTTSFDHAEQMDTGSGRRTIQYIVGRRVAMYVENFATLAATVYTYLQLQGPLALGASMLNVNGYKLYKGREYAVETSESVCGENCLDLGYRVTYELAGERGTITRALNDLLWNAFGFDECLYYRSGEFVAPS